MTEPTLVDKVREIIQKDPRYQLEAYKFIFEALDHTVKTIGARRHVSGRELLEGVRNFALQQFGGLTRTVFSIWGIQRTDDFGEIVFNLVEAGLMGKTETDSKEDFAGVYDFDDAFPLLFAQPKKKS